jgi:hypothetical protein
MRVSPRRAFGNKRRAHETDRISDRRSGRLSAVNERGPRAVGSGTGWTWLSGAPLRKTS